MELSLGIGTKAIRLLPAEFAHHVGMAALRVGSATGLLQTGPSIQDTQGLSVNVPGIGSLAHPIGLAAGFDKNAVAIKGLSRLGFSCIEIGTVTPEAQAGNPKPRLFRLADQRAIVNRMGFNNDGMIAIERRLRQALLKGGVTSVVGVNVGKNKSTANEDAIRDYTLLLNRYSQNAGYLVVNISSPNTPGLRELASSQFVEQLSQNIGNLSPKVWVKLDPDLPKAVFQEVVRSVADQGFAGLVLTNTHRVAEPEPGGLSGHPLSVASAARLGWAHEVHQGSLPMIASGGIFSGLDVLSRMARGADMVQIWSALIYRGPYAVKMIIREMRAEMRLRGIHNIEEIKGSYYDGNFA